MKKLSDYKGEEAIIINGKIMKPMGEIIADEKAIEVLKKNQFEAFGDIMQNHSKAVLEIVSAVSGGEFDGGNVGAYFMSIFAEYFQSFNNEAFFGFQATTE